jgi:hypothetical protein
MILAEITYFWTAFVCAVILFLSTREYYFEERDITKHTQITEYCIA